MIADRTNRMRTTTPSDREIVMVREFDAPRTLVWEAVTRPEHIKRWWGANGDVMTRCDMDFRVGGAWRYHIRNSPDSPEFCFTGAYREIHAPEKLVYTFIFEGHGIPGIDCLVSDVLTEQGNRTTLTETLLFPDKQERDTTLATGMADGAAESLDRLEDLLVELKQGRSS